ncbi:glutamine-rich protein 2-like isoform X2 [Lethenteron reissneri]|uniref:glutamine-rich protein 2-like isoform X2 n=1 Tax=Lethenteron reissneri TaxID=7753 RepID=UPI002AB69C3F|nr:glutamine-rich protein 2-like isoform X2 [Lethenteron reissneri]
MLSARDDDDDAAASAPSKMINGTAGGVNDNDDDDDDDDDQDDTVDLSDLVERAVSSLDPSSVNFSALGSVLRALVKSQHLGSHVVVPAGARDPPGGVDPRLGERLTRVEEALGRLLEASVGADAMLDGRAPPSSVVEMWKLTQVTKRTEANAEGVEKAMSLLGTLVEEMKSVRSWRDSLRGEVARLLRLLQASQAEISSLSAGMQAAQENSAKIAELQTQMEQSARWLGAFPQGAGSLVTWPRLLAALRGEDSGASHELQTEREGATDPPAEVALLTIGRLPARQQQAEARIGVLEQMLHEPRSELTHLVAEVARLRQRVERDSTSRSQDESGLRELSREVARLVDEGDATRKDIQSLAESLEQLQETKADRVKVDTDIEVKADKHALDGKVSCSLFSEATGRLHAMMDGLLQRVSGQEGDWQRQTQMLVARMDSKLDRMELDPLRRELEARWRAVKRRLQDGEQIQADDAAGFRRQLIARFHCISCDRPLDLPVPAPRLITVAVATSTQKNSQGLASVRLPAAPTSLSTRPSLRPCGGVHTIHAVHSTGGKRVARVPPLGQMVRAGEVPGVPASRTKEIHILGLDGHIYRGRLERSSFLPPIQSPEGNVRSEEGIQHRSPPSSFSAVHQPELDTTFIMSRSSSAISSSYTDLGNRPASPLPASPQVSPAAPPAGGGGGRPTRLTR